MWKFDINDYILDEKITTTVDLGMTGSFINNNNGKMTLKYYSIDFFS